MPKSQLTILMGKKSTKNKYNIDSLNMVSLLRNERKYFNLSKLDNNMYIIKVASSNFF